jgi:16S rRNA (guanine1207-N2)-methyltransferase
MERPMADTDDQAGGEWLREGVYGVPPPDLAPVGARAIQFSPLILDAPEQDQIEALVEGALNAITVAAPPGAIERRYVLAQALRVLKPGGRLTALAPKAKGGGRIAGELAAFGCTVQERAKHHQRICVTTRPADPAGLDDAIAAGGPQRLETLGLWTQPGVFSWDRIDPGSALLMQAPPSLAGRGADLGCGIGVLTLKALASPKVTDLYMADIDRRAVLAAMRNVTDPRASVLWTDARSFTPPGGPVDFVVMNPPFHDGGAEDRALGQAFVAAAARILRKGGACWMVANRHLPYEATLAAAFTRFAVRAEAHGYKVFEAVR